MNYDKIRKFCRIFRIVIGLALIITATLINNNWFYLGAIPLLAGLVNFCPLCIISKKCSVK
ncbi:MAG: DUF2892 domain-containing protein [Sulfurimonas sp.]|nr:DUF2892 domain-containing protein [Sulfurimonas sp.]